MKEYGAIACRVHGKCGCHLKGWRGRDNRPVGRLQKSGLAENALEHKEENDRQEGTGGQCDDPAGEDGTHDSEVQC